MGTLANIIILIASVLNFVNWNFNNMIKKEFNIFLENLDNDEILISNENILHLPSPVKKWLYYSNIVEKKSITKFL